MMLTDAANFRIHDYHRPTDMIETIDAVRFTRTMKGVAGAVKKVAEGGAAAEQPPGWRSQVMYLQALTSLLMNLPVR